MFGAALKATITFRRMSELLMGPLDPNRAGFGTGDTHGASPHHVKTRARGGKD